MKMVDELDNHAEKMAKVYNITFDLQKMKFLSQNSSLQPLTYTSKGKTPEIYTLYPILELIHNKAKTIAFGILPSKNCFLLGIEELRYYRYGRLTNSSDFFKSLKKGAYIVTKIHTSWKASLKGKVEIHAICLESSKIKILKLMKILDKYFQRISYSQKIDFSNFRILTLETIYKKFRAKTMEKIINSLETQLDGIKEVEKLREIQFEYPTPNIIKITLKTAGHTFVFEHSLGINPTLAKNSSLETEDVRFWKTAMGINIYWNMPESRKVAFKLKAIKNGIELLMAKKEWFKFSCDNKSFLVTRKAGFRYYIDGVMTKGDDVSFWLMKLISEEKKIIFMNIQKLRKIPEEVGLLLNKGIRGKVIDLEGEFPIRIKVLRENNRYSFQVRGKMFKVKGGFLAIKKLETALQNASRYTKTWDKLGVGSSRDYRFILFLLEDLIGDRAIEFYKECKRDSKEKEKRKEVE